MPSLEVERIVARFLDSWEARGVDATIAETRRIALLFVGSALDDLGIEPRLLDEQQFDAALAVTARKLGRGDPLAKAGGSIVRALFAHLKEVEYVQNAFELERALDGVELRFEKLTSAVTDAQRIAGETKTIVERGAKVGRNDPCPCGSGKKFKQCCAKAG
jgi:hypothetical protein